MAPLEHQLTIAFLAFSITYFLFSAGTSSQVSARYLPVSSIPNLLPPDRYIYFILKFNLGETADYLVQQVMLQGGDLRLGQIRG